MMWIVNLYHFLVHPILCTIVVSKVVLVTDFLSPNEREGVGTL